MFGIGPAELLILAIIGLLVIGPDRLPGVARDAARLLRALRDMARGTRAELSKEFGPEFDKTLANLNPRSALDKLLAEPTPATAEDPTPGRGDPTTPQQQTNKVSVADSGDTAD
jgi:sec-independent protein translocase protein TatB